jgi:hypothetical protein
MKMKKNIPVVLIMLSFLGARADVAELKNGSVLNGTFRGGTATSISFEANGNVMQLATSDLVSLKFTAPVAAPAPAAPPAPVAAAAAPAAAGPVTLPVGTLLLVRMTDTVSSKSAPGASFATKLEYDLVADGAIVAKAGTVVYGKVQSATQARRAAGRSTLDLRLVQIVPQGSPVPIATSGYQQAGDASIKKVAKAAAVGAVIGNNTGNGSGSDGAAIGAGVAMLKPGETLTVQAGTLVEFTLTQPVTLPAL